MALGARVLLQRFKSFQREVNLPSDAQNIEESGEGFVLAGKRETLPKLLTSLIAESSKWEGQGPYRTRFLEFLPLAHLLAGEEPCSKLRIELLESGVRVLLSGVDDSEGRLKGIVNPISKKKKKRKQKKQDGSEPMELGMLRLLVCSAIADWGGEVVLAQSLSGADAEAISVSEDGLQWGQASLEPSTFLIHFSPGKKAFSIEQLREKIHRDFAEHCFEDKVEVLVDGTFYGLQYKVCDQSQDDSLVSVGLWASTEGEKKARADQIALGQSFAQLDETGVKRRELTFQTFRVGTTKKGKLKPGASADSIVHFAHLESPQQSQTIWTWKGLEVGRQTWQLQPQELVMTMLSEVSVSEWKQGGPRFDPEIASKRKNDLATGFQKSLERMVEEYNGYSPSLDRSTMGCWFMLVLSSLALGGIVAPFLTSRLAGALSAIMALLLVAAEYRFRHAKRYAIGKSLERLALDWEEKGADLWPSTVVKPNGKPMSLEETP